MIDRILEWMSFRGTGSFEDIPSELMGNTTARRVVNDFALLAHVELEDEKSWRVVPPILAALPPIRGDASQAVLCGARTPGVCTSLTAACARTGAQIIQYALANQPLVIRISAPSHPALSAVAEAANLPLQPDASFTLLACTPTIRQWPRTPCAMVAGRVEVVRRFSRSRLHFVDSSLPEVTSARHGFFRIKRDWDWVSLLKTGISTCAYIDDRAGRLAAAAGLRVVKWAEDSKALSLPSQLFPPGIVARALTLCTGELPRIDRQNRRVIFGGVNPEMLALTMAITGLRRA